MRPYFKNIPNLEYINTTPDQHTLTDYITVKNLFRRPIIRSDIMENLSYFTRYTIVGDERPDNVAYKLYNDETLDWVILLCNNILNIQTEWPLPQSAFQEYLLIKYQTESNLYNGIHHYESVELKDSSGRIVFPGGITVDQNFSFQYYDYRRTSEIVHTEKLAITNYEYELQIEENKRTVFALRPEFLGILIEDAKLRYLEGSSQFIDTETKRVENIRLHM